MDKSIFKGKNGYDKNKNQFKKNSFNFTYSNFKNEKYGKQKISNVVVLIFVLIFQKSKIPKI